MARIHIPAEIRRMVIDIAIVSALYLLAQVALIEHNRPTDWTDWAMAIGAGIVARITPELVQLLGVLRQRYGEPTA